MSPLPSYFLRIGGTQQAGLGVGGQKTGPHLKQKTEKEILLLYQETSDGESQEVPV